MKNKLAKRFACFVLAASTAVRMMPFVVFAAETDPGGGIEPQIIQEVRATDETAKTEQPIGFEEIAAEQDKNTVIETGNAVVFEKESATNEAESVLGVYSIMVDCNEGKLSKEWLETANKIPMESVENPVFEVSEAEDGKILIETNYKSVSLVSPTPENDSIYFSEWGNNGGSIENDVFSPQEGTTSYTLTALYKGVDGESGLVENAEMYKALEEQGTAPIALFTTDGEEPFSTQEIEELTFQQKLELMVDGLEFTYQGKNYQTFTAPMDGEYIVTAYGANGGTGYGKYDGYGHPGRGGMTEATVTLKKGQTIYMYIGEAGGSWSEERTWGGGGAGCALNMSWPDLEDRMPHAFGRGGGATYISVDEFNLNDQSTVNQANWDYTSEEKAQNDEAAAKAKEHIIMVAAGGGGVGEMTGYTPCGGGYEGGVLNNTDPYWGFYPRLIPAGDSTDQIVAAKVDGKEATEWQRLNAVLYPATQTRGGYGLHYTWHGVLTDIRNTNTVQPTDLLYPEKEKRNWGSFFYGANASTCSGGGGGGWFGGGAENKFEGGGGSSFINTSVGGITITNPYTKTGGNYKYDSTASTPYYINGRVIIKLAGDNPQVAVTLREAKDEEISKLHPDTIMNDKFGQCAVIPADQTVSADTVGYTAIVYYNYGDMIAVSSDWQYATWADNDYKSWSDGVAKNKFGDDVKVEITNTNLGMLSSDSPYYVEEYDGWSAIKTQMTIKNVNDSMFDATTATGLRFRCAVTGKYTLADKERIVEAATESGRLTVTRSSDMHHLGVNQYNNRNTINSQIVTSYDEIKNVTADTQEAIWSYPDLKVETTELLRTFGVLFESPGRNPQDYITYDLDVANKFGIVEVGSEDNKIFACKDGLTGEQWTEFLRTVSFCTYDKMQIEDGKVTGGTVIKWAGTKDLLVNTDKPNIPQPWPGITTYDINKTNVHITQNGSYYIVGDKDVVTTKYIKVNSGVNATIFLENVNMRCDTGSDPQDANGGYAKEWSTSAPTACIDVSRSNTTIVLRGENTLTPNHSYSMGIMKNGHDGTLTIDGDGSLSIEIKGEDWNKDKSHMGGIGSRWGWPCFNMTFKNATISVTVAEIGGHMPGIGVGCANSYPGWNVFRAPASAPVAQREWLDATGGGNFVFDNCTVIARGGNSCSGIGSGSGGALDGIYIKNGAKVTAYGGLHSPGIGSGGTWNTGFASGNVSNLIVSGGTTEVTAYGYEKSDNSLFSCTPGIGCGTQPPSAYVNGGGPKLTNVIVQTDPGFQGYVRHGASEETAAYSTENPSTPFVGTGNMGEYLNKQARNGTPVFYTQITFAPIITKADVKESDIIGTQFTMVPVQDNMAVPISGTVFAENDENGVYDANTETPIAGVTVKLVRENGVTTETKTSAAGTYVFQEKKDALTNCKIVCEIPKSMVTGNFAVTKSHPMTDVGKTNKADKMSETDTFVTLETPASNMENGKGNLNLGINIPSSISGIVWDDTNRNGIYDAGEPLLDDALVSLESNAQQALHGDGTPIQPVKTDVNGKYRFDNVPASETGYKVVVSSNPDGLYIGNASATVVPAIPTNTPDTELITQNSNKAYNIPKKSADEKTERVEVRNVFIRPLYGTLVNTSVDYQNAGLKTATNVVGCVWVETDYDGIFEPNSTQQGIKSDVPLENIQVSLYDKKGNHLVAKVLTRNTGNFEWQDVAPGEYYIQVTRAKETTQDKFDANGKGSVNNDALSPFIPTRANNIESTETKFYNATASSENNQNGALENIQSAVFTVESMPVKEATANAQRNKYVGMGLFVPQQLTGVVWEDYNQNSLHEEDEALINGVSVTLLKLTGTDKDNLAHYSPIRAKDGGADEEILTLQTGQRIDFVTGAVEQYEEGKYSFDNLPNGTYALKFESGNYDIRYHIVSDTNAGTDDTIDNDAVGVYDVDGEELISAHIVNVYLPKESEITNYSTETLNIGYNDLGMYEKFRQITVGKTIKAGDINWSYGNPTFVISAEGTDPKGVLHKFTHCFEFTPDYVRQNTDAQGNVSMEYLFVDCNYAHTYRVYEENVNRYALQNVTGSDNMTVQDGAGILDLKIDVEGSVSFENRASDKTDTSHNTIVENESKTLVGWTPKN